MKFGEHIQRQREQDVHWGPHYLNYNDLKTLLERATTSTSAVGEDHERGGDRDDVGDLLVVPPLGNKENHLHPSMPHPMDNNSNNWIVTEEFSRLLYHETERMVLFVYEQHGKIAADLASYNSNNNRNYSYRRTDPKDQRGQVPPPPTTTKHLSSDIAPYNKNDDAAILPVGLLSTSSHHSSSGGLFIDEAFVVVDGENDARRTAIYERPSRNLASSGNDGSITQEGAGGATANITLSELSQRYCATGRAIIHLYQFVDVNVTGIRKILKKHDKLMGGAGETSLTELFLTPPKSYLMQHLSGSLHGSSPRLAGGGFGNTATGMVSFTSSPLDHRTFARAGSQMIQPLLHEDYLGALVIALESGVQAMLLQQHETTTKLPLFRRSTAGPSESLKSRSFNELAMMRSSSSPKLLIQQQRKGFRNSSASLATNYLPPSDVDVMLSQVRVAQRRLRQQTSHFVHFLAAPMMVARQGSSDYDDDASAMGLALDDTDMNGEDQSRISNWLNLLSTVFFMTNYYIVAPTSGNYAHLLGGNAALASLIVGMTPLAALVSTVLYSWWTSYSYKRALIFASVCSTVGNLFYAAGLPCNSLTLVLIGRLLNGFGSARSINRRYIADTFSRADRTAASAAFVTAGAMGMAAGPLLASLLHLMITLLPNNQNNLYLQSENAPGWFMFGVWATYLVCLIVYFQDPPRKITVNNMPMEDKCTETSPLLTSNSNDRASYQHEPPTSEKQQQQQESLSLLTNVPVIVTLFVCAVLKLQNEAVLCAAANLAKYYFQWTPSFVGLYLASLGLMMLPANLIVGYYARRHEDRDLIIGLLVIMVLGGCLMLDYTGTYSIAQYMVASFVLFVASTALEGPNMSLLSKSIPASWSQGVFNVGLLATESGTFGRTVADALLTLFGADGIDHLLNRTFVAATLISITALALCCRFFDRLRSFDRDE